MILDDKVIMSLPPPPPYLPSSGSAFHAPASPTFSNPPPPFSEALASPSCSYPGRSLKLSSLPPHILLQIVYNTFPTNPGGLVERQRKSLLWLAKSLRLVNKAFYIACMHVLRSTYLPAYTSLLRPYYSSDPFPSTPVPQVHTNSLNTIQRETPVLDLYIALKVREDVFVDDSELHLEREDMFKDIFDHSQPKARLEDLIRIYGVKEGVITLAPPGVVTYTSTSNSSYSSNGTVVARRANQPLPIRPVPFALLSVSFGTRKVGLQLISAETGTKRTIVDVQRMSRDESLEAAAARVVEELKGLLLG
ncbi:hypothetical protein FA15DRAFT_586788 [Coprinopsis marcescibilis]|uniref:Uncharacterized protein n=1 Tax=Coprinopsis marcescibilis TaxID=230819 RepID=A0A5C3L3U6_COPMA|nr:hypothetical protein FA15DRAFT_586788 [Coprinopsis marcescibilis]